MGLDFFEIQEETAVGQFSAEINVRNDLQRSKNFPAPQDAEFETEDEIGLGLCTLFDIGGLGVKLKDGTILGNIPINIASILRDLIEDNFIR